MLVGLRGCDKKLSRFAKYSERLGFTVFGLGNISNQASSTTLYVVAYIRYVGGFIGEVFFFPHDSRLLWGVDQI